MVSTNRATPTGHSASAVEAALGTVGTGEHGEEEADREVDLIARKRNKTQNL